MNKSTKNIKELNMNFAVILEKGIIKEKSDKDGSIQEYFKENVTDWAQEFEKLYTEDTNYADMIKIFLFHKLKTDNWFMEDDAIVDLMEYGYYWDGMKQITYLDALYRFIFENKTVYLLYPDNTEAAADNLKELSRHYKNNGVFGFEIALNDKINC